MSAVAERRPREQRIDQGAAAPAEPAGSLFSVGRNCSAVARAQRVATLIDGEAYFSAFMRAAERAERSILIVAWDFDSRTGLCFGEDGHCGETIGDFLNRLVKQRRRLTVRVLDWDYPMIFGTDREFPPLYGLSWKPHRRVQFRYDTTSAIGASHHQKIVVIDDKMAFVGGLDLTGRRWDTCKHQPDDARRTMDGDPYPPFHDAMIAVDGAAAAAVAAVARDRWQGATGKTVRQQQTDGDPWPPDLRPDLTDVDVAVACTSPATSAIGEVRHVEALYLDTIARARRYLYLENQYFTSDAVGDALARRLAEPNGPEVIVITRLLSHGWLEEMTMHVLRTRLVRKLRAADRYGRFHIYYPHVEGLAEGTCIDVHTKLLVADDAVLRIGSANLNNRSMGLDTECDLALEAGGRPDLVQAVQLFRDRLIGEHTGTSTAAVAAAVAAAPSLHAAIATLGNAQRSLLPLPDPPMVSETLADAVSLTDPERPSPLDRLVKEFSVDPETTPNRGKGPPRRQRWIAVAAATALVTALTLAWRYTPLATWITVDNVTGWANAFAANRWAPLLVVLAYTPASFIMFPRPLITLAAIVAFGVGLGLLYSMAGILLAASVAFIVGARLDRDHVRRFVGERLNRIAGALKQHGLLAMTLVRMVPVAPFAVVSMAAGAIRVKYWHFFVGTALGMLPGAVVAAVFGTQLKSALHADASVNYWLIGGVVAAVAGLVLAFRKRALAIFAA